MREIKEQYMDHLILMVIGSRSVTKYENVREALDYLLQNNPKTVIVSGGAQGADKCAKMYAEERHLPYEEFPADWSKGARAGYERNKEMHEYIAQYPFRYVVAFWDGQSKGTRHSFELSKQYNNPLRVLLYSN